MSRPSASPPTTQSILLNSIHHFSQGSIRQFPNYSKGYINLTLLLSSTDITRFPLNLCRMFEKAFGLTWNETISYYTVNDSSHETNLRENKSVTFTVSGGKQGMDITFPYQAFDMQLSYPLIEELNTSIRYFPIRRTLHQEIYMLGRAFLQGLYIIRDYQRANFSIFEAAFGGNSRVTPILAIESEGNLGNNTTAIPQTTHRLSSGAYAGIGVGSAVAISLLAAAVLAWRRRSRTLTSSETQATIQKAELHGEGKPHLEAMSSSRLEMETSEPGHEMRGSQTVPFEMQGSELPVHELGHENNRRT